MFCVSKHNERYHACVLFWLELSSICMILTIPCSGKAVSDVGQICRSLPAYRIQLFKVYSRNLGTWIGLQRGSDIGGRLLEFSGALE